MFRDADDAHRWSVIRAEITDEPSVILSFSIPDNAWERLKILHVRREDDFRFHYDTVAERYQDAEVLEGAWAPTTYVRENLMIGAWQYKFNAHAFHVLDAALRSDADE